ncbi:AbiH family protein (plasmid) [Priestia megaterium]
MTKLFIIGNGFDSAHGLKTSYNNFKDYLTLNCSGINLEELIVPEEIHEDDGGITYDENEVISMIFYLLNQAERNTAQWQAKIKSGEKKWSDEVE